MKRTLLLLLFSVLTGCGAGTGHPAATQKVFKPDGSKQCESEGTSVEEMGRELSEAGIDVICGQKGHDGYARAQVCGNETGRINVYTIHSQNRPDAESLGFAPVTDLPEYRDTPCPN